MLSCRFFCLLALIALCSFYNRHEPQINFFKADHPDFQYTGRIDFTDPIKPRFWQPGVYVKARFRGSFCSVLIGDEMLGGHSHNYVTIVVDDGEPKRIKLKEKNNTVNLKENLSPGEHTIVIQKDTESGIGYVEFKGLICESLLPEPPRPKRKLEFIGDSITAGMESDLSGTPCDEGVWYDQHNAWKTYGAITARSLDAEWHLTAVSGIGMMRSCCKMTITMPQVFDKINQREDSIAWDFGSYQPDAVTICLGQNDGIQDSVNFTNTYVQFVREVRKQYPEAAIICLSSPMASGKHLKILKNYLAGIVGHVNDTGDKRVHQFLFSSNFNHGCQGHPDVKDHQQMAAELTAFLRKTMAW